MLRGRSKRLLRKRLLQRPRRPAGAGSPAREGSCRLLAVAKACDSEAQGQASAVHAGVHKGWGGRLRQALEQREPSQDSQGPLHIRRMQRASHGARASSLDGTGAASTGLATSSARPRTAWLGAGTQACVTRSLLTGATAAARQGGQMRKCSCQ